MWAGRAGALLTSRALTLFGSLAARLPAFSAFFWLGAALLLLFVALVDRHGLLDQSEYVDYFTQGPDLDWLSSFSLDRDRLFLTGVAIVTEELGWRLWTLVVGTVMSPWAATIFTVVALNAIVVFASAKLRYPLLLLALWVFAPVGMAVIGVIQLRQGLAYSLFLFIALEFGAPLRALIIVSSIHTTFFVPLVCALCGRFVSKRIQFAAASSVVVGVVLAFSGRALFEEFGGRRLATFTPDEGATSLFFVLGSVLLAAPSFWWLFFERAEQNETRPESPLDQIAIAHVGVTAFVVVSFFVFPLGTSRVGYFTQLFALPLVASIRCTPSGLVFAICPAVTALVYWFVRAVEDGLFAHLGNFG